VIEQRQLQCARPRPELADGERGDGLEGADEPLEPLRVEAARARPDQFERQGVNAGESGEFVGSDAGKPLEERGRQVVMDVACGGRDDVEVVEEPFGAGGMASCRVLASAVDSRSARMWSSSCRK
jgi:hypothetical protein